MNTTSHTTNHTSYLSSLPAFAVMLLAAFAFTSTSHAVDYTWDPTSGDSVVTEGSGNWDTTTTNWTTDVGVTNTNAPAGAFTSRPDLRWWYSRHSRHCHPYRNW